MRLVLVGPIGRDIRLLSRALWVAMHQLHADRIVYLGSDHAIDAVVDVWAHLWSAETALHTKAATVINTDAASIRTELQHEQLRTRLKCIQSLAGHGVCSIELLLDRVVVMIDDKALFDEEDILPASILAFGYGDALLRKVGSRMFVAPGVLNHKEQGLALLQEDATQGILISLHALDGKETLRDCYEVNRVGRARFNIY